MGKHLWKLVLPGVVTFYLYDFLSELAPGRNILLFSIFAGLTLGLFIGFLLDLKRNKKLQIKELNKNIKELNKHNSNFSINNDVKNSSSNLVDRLHKLNELREKNAISQEEFLTLKEKLMKE